MNSYIEAKVKQYLRKQMHYDPVQAGSLVYYLEEAARMVGHGFNERFAGIGLEVGAEAKLASEVCGRALCSGAFTASETVLKKHLDRILMKNPLKHVTQM